MGIDSNLAGIARVAFETTGTGEVNRDIHAVEANYRRAAAGTSESALKVQLAQDRLQKVIARGPHNYRALAAAELNLRRAESELAAQSHRTSTALQHEERTLGRLTRGALSGSGIFHGLGRSLAFASAGFLGGTGFVYAIRSATKAAEEHQVVEGQLKAALGAVGLSYQKYGRDIDEALAHQRSLTGFTEEQTARSFTALVRATGSVSSAMRALGVAQNIARGATIPLETATLKVVRAFNGQTRGLTALGLAIPKGVKGFQALDFANEKFAGSVEEHSRNAVGAQERLNQAIHTTEITIGTGLLPTITRLSTQLADWLGKSENQTRIQRDVNQAVHDGAVVVHLLAGALGVAHDVAVPLVRILGGVENTLKLIASVKLARVLSGWAGGFAGLGGAARRAEGEVAASMVGMEAATAAPLAGIGRLRGALLGLTRLSAITIPIFVAIEYREQIAKGLKEAGKGGRDFASDLVHGRIGSAIRGRDISVPQGAVDVRKDIDRARKYLAMRDVHFNVLSNGDIQVVNGAGVVYYTYRNHDTTGYELIVDGGGKRLTGRANQAIGRRSTYDPTYTPKKPRLASNREEEIKTQLARTQGTSGSERVAALRDQVGFDDKYIRIQERLLKTDVAHRKQHAATLQRLYAERSGAQGEIDSINQGDAQKAQGDAQKAQAAADKARQAQAEAANKAKQAAEERARQYRAGLATTVERLQSRVAESRTPAGRRRAEDALVRFYEHERRDRQLTDKERGRYRLLAAKERQHAHEIAVKDARSAKEATLKNAVKIAEIAAEKAGEGTAAYNKAIAAEEKALQAEANYYARLAKIDKGRKRQQDLANKLAAEKRKAALEKKTGGKTDGKTGGKSEDFAKLSFEFLQSLHGTINDLGGNLAPMGALHVQGQVQTSLLRRQNDLLEGLASGVRHPNSRYARTEMTSALDGISF